MLIASMLWETAQSRKEHRIRRGGEEEKAEDLLYLKRAIGGPHVLLSGLCSAPLCVQSNKQSVRNMAGGARKENRRERGHVCSYTNQAPGPHSNAHRSGLVVTFEHPGRREWRGSGEGVISRERWQAGQH